MILNDFYKDKNILVTGGSGVIGTPLIKKLISLGAQVRNVDFRVQPQVLNDLGVEQVQVDLSDPNSQILFRFEPEIVFHLAADFERSEETKNFWDSNWKNNVLASRNLLEQIIKFNTLNKIVFASSYLIYDKKLYSDVNNPRQLSEKDIVDPRNLCGLSKLQTETDLEFLSTFYDIAVSSARIYRVYGCGDRSIISRWVRNILNEQQITVYGQDNSFDYIFADDVADGLIYMGAHNTKSTIYNLGSGECNKIIDVLDILKNHFGNVDILYHNKNPQPEASFANIKNIKTDMGWAPSTKLYDGIKKVIEYEKHR